MLRHPFAVSLLGILTATTLQSFCISPSVAADASRPSDDRRHDDDDHDRNADRRRDRDDDDDDEDDRGRGRRQNRDHHGDGDGDCENEDSDLPQLIQVTATIRDFLPHDEEGGHADFGIRANGHGDVVVGLLASRLNEDGLPVFDGSGQRIRTHWTDSRRRNINPALYSAALGDNSGRYRGNAVSGDIISSASFSQWFSDATDFNQSTDYTLVLTQVGETDGQATYRFATSDFTPIDGMLFDDHGNRHDDDDNGRRGRGHEEHGNGRGRGHDHHDHDDDEDDRGEQPNRLFTMTLTVSFEFEADADQFLSFSSADDLWVFVGDTLVIDLGARHNVATQRIDLSRLGLSDGHVYDLRVFFAQRANDEAPLTIETNMILEDDNAGGTAGAIPTIVQWSEVEPE